MAGDWAVSNLKIAAEEYVAIRRSTGFKFEQAANLLSDFVGHLERKGSSVITSTAAISWASAVGGHPNWWGKRLSVVRGFARYLHGLEPDHEVPPTGLFPTRPCRATPYLYGDDDVARLMMAARSLRASWGRTMETLIGLLASTGMRVGEAIHLDVTDIDWAGGVLVVRSTKFGLCGNRHRPNFPPRTTSRLRSKFTSPRRRPQASPARRPSP